MLLTLLVALAYAQEDIHAVSANTSATVRGPAVWMTEARFTEMLVAEQSLSSCEASLARATEYGLLASTQSEAALSLTKKQLEDDALLIQALQQDVDALRLSVEDLRTTKGRLREQRNLAWGIAGGFILAAVTAVVIEVQ